MRMLATSNVLACMVVLLLYIYVCIYMTDDEIIVSDVSYLIYMCVCRVLICSQIHTTMCGALVNLGSSDYTHTHIYKS